VIGNVSATAVGSFAATGVTLGAVGCPGGFTSVGNWSGLFRPGQGYSFSFAQPCPGSEVIYVPSFGDSQQMTLVAGVPTDYFGNPLPGNYQVFDNISAGAEYSITASPLPEPGAYGVLAGLIMAGLIAIKVLRRQTRG